MLIGLQREDVEFYIFFFLTSYGQWQEFWDQKKEFSSGKNTPSWNTARKPLPS